MGCSQVSAQSVQQGLGHRSWGPAVQRFTSRSRPAWLPVDHGDSLYCRTHWPPPGLCSPEKGAPDSGLLHSCRVHKFWVRVTHPWASLQGSPPTGNCVLTCERLLTRRGGPVLAWWSVVGLWDVVCSLNSRSCTDQGAYHPSKVETGAVPGRVCRTCGPTHSTRWHANPCGKLVHGCYCHALQPPRVTALGHQGTPIRMDGM
jgi:hypothetical protein